ncbi:hypothetical protein LRM64_10120 [Prescottella equi]|nr:hypothetical protein [Prescottella equi]MCU7531902.1 hypothetical protein [Prescottella equi]MCU7534034.1 hypothetical protein [Prescottella equi]
MTCKYCHLPVYTMWRPVSGEKLVHRGTHLAECADGGTSATPRSEA